MESKLSAARGSIKSLPWNIPEEMDQPAKPPKRMQPLVASLSKKGRAASWYGWCSCPRTGGEWDRFPSRPPRLGGCRPGRL